MVRLAGEARIGAELKAAQERGEVATDGRPISVQGTDTSRATLTDLGIPRQRAAEMKALAKAGPERIHAEVSCTTRARVEAAIERLVALLDAMDGDPDMEPDTDDCCGAADDDLSSRPCRQHSADWGPGTPDDAEPDDDGEASRQPCTLAPDLYPSRAGRLVRIGA